MKLRVATYNIHKGVMGLRQKVRIHDVRLALKAIDADIVFLQEVQDRNERLAKRKGYPEGTQLDYLCTGSYLHRAYGMNAVYPHGHHGNAIVSRHEIGVFLNHDISDHALEKREPPRARRVRARWLRSSVSCSGPSTTSVPRPPRRALSCPPTTTLWNRS